IPLPGRRTPELARFLIGVLQPLHNQANPEYRLAGIDPGIPTASLKLLESLSIISMRNWRKNRGEAGYFRSGFFRSRSIRSWTRRIARRLSLASGLPEVTLSAMRHCHFQMP